MCLIVFAWRPTHAQPLIVAANRDEFYARTSLPLAKWQDHPEIYAGRDLKAGGTWLGVSQSGRFAALTNIRNPQLIQGGPSRGELVADYLRGQLGAEDYLTALSARSDEYAGFNLLLGDTRQLWHFNQQQAVPRKLPEGIYGLSNADLDSPWPKVQRVKTALEKSLQQPSRAALLDLLQDAHTPADSELPETGVALPIERMLSSVFIASPSYGTCASTALIMHADGLCQLAERRYAADGVLQGEIRLDVRQTPSVLA